NVIAPGVFAEWRREATSFSQMAIFGSGSYNLSGGQGQVPEKIESTNCSGDFFTLLGVEAAYGRMIGPGDDKPQADAVAVLSWGLWKRRFGGDPSVIGTRVLLDGVPYAIVGIAPSWFAYPDMQTQVWTPIYHEVTPSAMTDLGNHEFNAIARLR